MESKNVQYTLVPLVPHIISGNKSPSEKNHVFLQI